MDEPKRVNIVKFLDHKGQVIQIPAKARTLLPLLQYVISTIEDGASYSEKEINSLLQAVCMVDYMTIRRLLIDKGYLMRTPNGSVYWKGDQIPSCWRLPDEEKEG